MTKEKPPLPLPIGGGKFLIGTELTAVNPMPKTLQTRETFVLVKDSTLGHVQVADELGFAYLDGDIDFGAVGKNEIFQNIKYIILTEYFSVPLDREFGMDYSMVDKPMRIAEAILSQEVAMKIALYEPRAQFREISFVEDMLNGKLSPTVKVVLLTTNELPSTIEPVGTPAAAPLVIIEDIDLPAFYESLIDIARTPGPMGPTGPTGEAATIEVGTTTTGDPGTDANVSNVGDESNAIFDFLIPKGEKGDEGQGINIKGTVANSSLLPMTGNSPGDMWIASDTGHGWSWDGDSWNDVGPIQGPPGPSNVLTVSSTTTSAPGGNADVSISGTSPAQSLAFTIPRGAAGPQGLPGADGGAGQVWRGTWDSMTSYAANDAVEYMGSTFICTDPNTGVPPVPDTGSNWLPPLANTGNRGSLAALAPSNQTSLWARGDNTWQTLPILEMMPVGSVIQTVVATYSLSELLNPIIPADTTPPLNTEGTQIISRTFTPRYANSRVMVWFRGTAARMQAGHVAVAGFRDGILIGGDLTQTDANGMQNLGFQVFDLPNTTTTVTYTLRAGPGSTGGMRFNGATDTPYLGGASFAMLTLQEIKQ